MHAVHFDKAYAQQVLDAIQGGRPIPVPPDNWTGNRMLTLAGILYTAVWSQGPHSQQVLGPAGAKLAQMHPEHREASQEALTQDIKDAIEFVSVLTFKVIDGVYDKHCEPNVKAIVFRDEGKPSVLPAEGFKAT